MVTKTQEDIKDTTYKLQNKADLEQLRTTAWAGKHESMKLYRTWSQGRKKKTARLQRMITTSRRENEKIT
jgi:hypothetical protein